MGVCWWTVMNAVIEHGTPLVENPDAAGVEERPAGPVHRPKEASHRDQVSLAVSQRRRRMHHRVGIADHRRQRCRIAEVAARHLDVAAAQAFLGLFGGHHADHVVTVLEQSVDDGTADVATGTETTTFITCTSLGGSVNSSDSGGASMKSRYLSRRSPNRGYPLWPPQARRGTIRRWP